MSDSNRQIAKAITRSPAQTPLKPPVALDLTRGTISGIGVIIAGIPTTTVKLPGSAVDVPVEVSIGYGAKEGDVVDILVAPPRLIVLGTTSASGGLGGFPDLKGDGDPNGAGLNPFRGEWYENTADGTLWLASGGDDNWTHMNPGVITGGAEYGFVNIDVGYDNILAEYGFSNLIMTMGWGNTVNAGVSAYAYGAGNTITGQGMALGGGNVVDGFKAVAIGYGCNAEIDGQIAIGAEFGTDLVTFAGIFNIFFDLGSDPNGAVTSINEGDICQTASGGLYVSGVAASNSDWTPIAGGGGGGTVDSVVPGTGINVDDTDPANPVVSLASGGGGITVSSPTFTSDTYTFVLGDANTFQVADNGATAGTMTIPLNSDVPFPVGTVISIMQPNTGAISVTAVGGVDVVASVSGGFISGSTGCRVQDSTIAVVQIATDIWVMTGDAA